VNGCVSEGEEKLYSSTCNGEPAPSTAAKTTPPQQNKWVKQGVGL